MAELIPSANSTVLVKGSVATMILGDVYRVENTLEPAGFKSRSWLGSQRYLLLLRYTHMRPAYSNIE